MKHGASRALLGIASLAVAGAVLLPTSSAAPASASPTTQAAQAFAAMTRTQRVGQLLMVGCPSTTVTSACLTAIRSHAVGSVILDGTSTLSIAGEHAVTAALQ